MRVPFSPKAVVISQLTWPVPEKVPAVTEQVTVEPASEMYSGAINGSVAVITGVPVMLSPGNSHRAHKKDKSRISP